MARLFGRILAIVILVSGGISVNAGSGFDWKEFLSGWEKEAITNFQHQGESGFVEQMRRASSNKGAPADLISSAEKRIGRPLPPSYKAFISQRNGWFMPSSAIVLLPINRIDLIKKVEPEMLEDWGHGDIGVPHDPRSRPVKGEHMKDAVLISEDEDGQMYLLNPNVVDKNGEWEAWAMGAENPGVFSYPSFESMLKYERSASPGSDE